MTRGASLLIVALMQPTPLLKDVSIAANTSGANAARELRIEANGRLIVSNVSTRELIQAAYSRQPFDRPEIAGAPAWFDSDRFDIRAAVSGDDRTAIIKALLAERFQLKTRTEKRDQAAYALLTARSDASLGPRLVPSNVDCEGIVARQRKGERPAFDAQQGPPCSISPHKGRLTANDVTMSELASVLSGFLDRRVVDRTGLTGRFDVDLVAAEIPAMGPPGPSYRPPDSSPPIRTALPEQLGLTLGETTASVEVIVIEAVRHPVKP